MGVDRVAFGPPWVGQDGVQRACQPPDTRQRTDGAGQDEQAAQAAADRKDKCDLSPDWEQQVDWGRMLQDCLQQLSAAHRNVDITIADMDVEDLQAYAAGKGPGAHLVLSTKFLERMASGAESFFKGKALLEGLMSQLGSQARNGIGVGAYVDEKSVTFWSAVPKEEEKKPWEEKADQYQSLFEMMEEMRKKAEENKNKFQIKIGSGMFNSPALAFSMLARANSVPAVKQAMAQADRCICTMKLALAMGPEKDKAKIRAAIAALEKVIVRGSGKVRDLNEEDDLRRRQKRAEQERQMRRADQMKYELEQRRTKRRAREYGQIVEGQPWFYYQQEMMRKKQIPTPEEMGLDMAGMPVDVGGGMGEVALPEGGGFAPSEVSVSPSIEISI